MSAVSLISYNVNGIRSAIRKGLLEWLKANPCDIVCLQETKALPEQVDLAPIEQLGYSHYWHSAEKKGYSGVSVLTKITPDKVEQGIGIDKYDREGRLVRLDFKDTTLLNAYFPSGSSGDHRQAVKMDWLEDFCHYINRLKKERPRLIISGDFNICHRPIDIHDPVRNAASSGFLPEEREWMSQFFDAGFIDTFRYFDPSPHRYSWWSFRANSRANNKGWRIDYNVVSKPMEKDLIEAGILSQAKHSDHCPVFLKIKINF